MTTLKELETPKTNTWCPGCGNFSIHLSFKQALVQLGLEPEKVVAVAGIGCHGKITDYLKVNGLHVVHGRVLPAASAVKLANHDLTVVGFSGDGDCYNIGMGHFPHAIRRNHDITLIVHDNMIYGLTTGQASPTTRTGQRTRTTPRGVIEPNINPIALALSNNASFVARGFAGEPQHLTELMKQAISHRGFALIDVLQPCVTWDKTQTYAYYRERVYKLEESDHDVSDIHAAYDRSTEWGDRIPIGIFYRKERPPFREKYSFLAEGPLVENKLDYDISKLLKEFR